MTFHRFHFSIWQPLLLFVIIHTLDETINDIPEMSGLGLRVSQELTSIYNDTQWYSPVAFIICLQILEFRFSSSTAAF